MLENLVKPVLFILAGALVKLAFDYLKVPLDEATFNAIVGAIVSVLLGLFGYAGLKKAAPSLF